MDSSEEKKPRRPRIGENRIAASSSGDGLFNNSNRTADAGESSSDAPRREYSGYDRPYQPRPYVQRGYNNGRSGYNNNQGGYNNNRQQGGYNRYNNQQGGYQPRQYQQQSQPVDGVESSAAESASTESAPTTGYSQQGGYNNNRQQGGYNNNRQQYS